MRRSKRRINGDAALEAPDVSLEVDPGIEVETPLLWIPSLREADWRIAVTQPGEHEVRVRIGGEVYSKRVKVSDDIVRRTPVRPSAGFVDQLVYPVERPLPKNAPVESITVTYAEAEIGFLFLGHALDHRLLHYFDRGGVRFAETVQGHPVSFRNVSRFRTCPTPHSPLPEYPIFNIQYSSFNIRHSSFDIHLVPRSR